MAIIRQYHKDTDTTYVYESISYWDAEKGQSRSKRRVIGKVDPVTGEIIPTGRRGRTKKQQTPDTENGTADSVETQGQESSQKRILEFELSVTELNARISELEAELRRYRAALEKVRSCSEKIDGVCRELTQT